jgi:RNA-directed DNA polymerase
MSDGMASEVQQLKLSPALDNPPDGGQEDEAVTHAIEGTDSVTVRMMERVVEVGNLRAALSQVRRNKGGPGIDGLTVERLPDYLKVHWPEIRTQILNGTYRPAAVKRVLIPKVGGGARSLGIPTVVDRFIQQALLQVLQAEWDQSFSHSSYGFRPKRSAHQAVARSQEYVRAGKRWVVDLDLEKFFDTVNHDVLMHKVRQRVEDDRVVTLIRRFLKSGACIEGAYRATRQGTPQGGPLSPLLANLLLDELDQELERRRHAFVRYADDCNIYVSSRRAGERVLGGIRSFLEKRLKLKVNEQKSAVDRPWKRRILGFTLTRGRHQYRRAVSEKALEALKAKVRRFTRRTRGHTLTQIIAELRTYLLGWKAYFGFAEVLSPLTDLDKWIRRKLRCYQWKQWGRAGYRRLRSMGIDQDLAWNTAKSAHGPWRLSKSPALSYAMDRKYFTKLGLPTLAGS